MPHDFLPVFYFWFWKEKNRINSIVMSSLFICSCAMRWWPNSNCLWYMFRLQFFFSICLYILAYLSFVLYFRMKYTIMFCTCNIYILGKRTGTNGRKANVVSKSNVFWIAHCSNMRRRQGGGEGGHMLCVCVCVNVCRSSRRACRRVRACVYVCVRLAC